MWVRKRSKTCAPTISNMRSVRSPSKVWGLLWRPFTFFLYGKQGWWPVLFLFLSSIQTRLFPSNVRRSLSFHQSHHVKPPFFPRVLKSGLSSPSLLRGACNLLFPEGCHTPFSCTLNMPLWQIVHVAPFFYSRSSFSFLFVWTLSTIFARSYAPPPPLPLFAPSCKGLASFPLF